MPRQILRFSVHQTAKVLAAIYGLMGLIFTPFLFFAWRTSPEAGLSPALLIAFPLVYAAFGYVFVAIGCLIYNFVVRFTGGIEVELGASKGGDLEESV